MASVSSPADLSIVSVSDDQWEIVEGLQSSKRSIPGFWVAPAVRRDGIGRTLAIEVLSRHQGPWSIAFQHDNTSAGVFWRAVADLAFGAGRWTETLQPVPNRPDAPPDHLIESFGCRKSND